MEAVEASSDGICHYRPCRVTLRSGEARDCVYVVRAREYIGAWGVWPEDDRWKRSIPIEDVVQVESSPRRLPAALANKLYAAGESGMGYTVFTVVLADDRRLPFLTGNAVDFPMLPDGVNTADVVDVLPGEGREYLEGSVPPEMGSADYYWCLYD